MIPVFGRTNIAVPRLWFRPEAGQASPMEIADAICGTENPVVDFSGNMSLWGHAFRGQSVMAMTHWGADLEKATSETHAGDLLGAHLISALSATQRTTIDFYFLRLRRTLEEYQLLGALETLENAKQDGLIRFIGLFADGPSIAIQGTWRFHDAFEALLIERNPGREKNFAPLEGMAKERRVGLVTSEPFAWPQGDLLASRPELAASYAAGLAATHSVIVPLRSPQQIELFHSAKPLSQDEIQQKLG